MRYVIIGNSAAGIGCAEGIRKTDKDGEIIAATIVEGEIGSDALARNDSRKTNSITYCDFTGGATHALDFKLIGGDGFASIKRAFWAKKAKF